VYKLPLVRSISRTMVQGRTYGPQVLVRRLATKGRKCRPILNQVAKQVVAMRPAELRLPTRAWKVIIFPVVTSFYPIYGTIGTHIADRGE